MSAARSFPLSLRQAFRMGNNDRSKVIARRRTRTTEKKNKNSVFMRAGSSYGDTKKRPDDFTISFTVFFFFLQRENRKCKAATILHVGERTQANTSSILLSGKQKTGFLTTAIMHLLLVRMLHHTYTKCSFFYRKHHGQ